MPPLVLFLSAARGQLLVWDKQTFSLGTLGVEGTRLECDSGLTGERQVAAMVEASLPAVPM